MLKKLIFTVLTVTLVGVSTNCLAANDYNEAVISTDKHTALSFKINQGVINEAIKILEPAINNAGKNKPSNGNPGSTGSVSINSAQFLKEVQRLVNVERAKQGLRPLVTNDDIENSAMVRAKELVIKYSHTRPDGRRGITALSHWDNCCAENIAQGYKTPADVMRGWMSSDGHRGNILHPNFTEIGVGYVYTPNEKYKHHWVQLFRG